MVAVLCASQAVLSLLGPAGVLICREPDGTSHLELAVVACCASETNGRQAAPIVPPSTDDDAAPACDEGGCTDQVFAHEKPFWGRSRDLLGAGSGTGQAWLLIPSQAGSTPAVACASRCLSRSVSSGGPPAHLVASRRSTVLIV